MMVCECVNGFWLLYSDFCMYMLMEAHVALVAGVSFGAEGYFRMSYAASEEQLREAIKRIKEALAKLA